MDTLHIPVMTKEVFEFIELKQGGTYADLTFGEGGHSKLFLNEPIKTLHATDRDLSAVNKAMAQKEWSAESRFHLYHSRYSDFPSLIKEEKFDGILIDLGVSTRQLLEAERGFSFSGEGPLDMRMDDTQGETLREILEGIEAKELAENLRRYTDLEKSNSIARRIIEKFNEGSLQTTKDLAKLMGKPRPGKPHPATALFLGLRMLVNQELEEIESTIPKLIPLLKSGGRLVVLTFHSTEDRCVKRMFRLLAGMCICERDICSCPRKELVKILTPKPVVPTEKEIQENPRARSTKLRAIEKI